jgi:rRNA pseudouridine-1189 N-methylase Emg1 (Nep1/Mra1 family)
MSVYSINTLSAQTVQVGIGTEIPTLYYAFIGIVQHLQLPLQDQTW